MLKRRRRERGQLRFAVLEALWLQGEGTAAHVRERISGRSKPALTTVSTVLQRLERSGEVVHRLEGRQHVYRALVTPADVRRKGVTGLLRQMFAGDPVSLVAQLVDSGTLTSDDLARIRALIARHERQRGHR